MAAPVDAARTGTNISTAATSHNINVGSPSSGDLLIVFVRFAAPAGTVTFTGYTRLATDTSDLSDDDSYLYYRQADGTEGASDVMSTTNSVKLAAICWRLTGAENPTNMTPGLSAVLVGTAANANPPATPQGGEVGWLIPSGAGSALLNGVGGTGEKYGQSFSAGSSPITSFAITLFKGGTPTDNVVVEIQSDSGGFPSGTVVGTVGTISGTTITTTAARYDLSCSIALTVGQPYWLVVSRSGARDTVNRYALVTAATNVDAYPSAPALQTSGSWVAGTSELSMVINPLSRDYLYLTVLGLDHETATATQPTGYSNLASANSGTGGAVATNCQIWGASKSTTNTATDDPGAWTSTAATTGWTAWTIAIAPPAAVAAATKAKRYPQPYAAAMRRAAVR